MTFGGITFPIHTKRMGRRQNRLYHHFVLGEGSSFVERGGGYVHGVPEQFGAIIKDFIETEPCIIVAPDYRKAVESPYPAAFNDCYDTLLWMRDNAASIGGRTDGFIVSGHSAGGGLSAAVSLKATDTGDAKLAFQMPVYPMIDDRTCLHQVKRVEHRAGTQCGDEERPRVVTSAGGRGCVR
mgnify:CR=1 FL=1